jgi:hypothetical protein
VTEQKLQELGRKIVKYCTKFDVPIDFLFEILEDQKVKRVKVRIDKPGALRFARSVSVELEAKG